MRHTPALIETESAHADRRAAAVSQTVVRDNPIPEPQRAVSHFSIMRDTRLIIAAIGECWRHLIRPIEQEGFPQEMFSTLIRLEGMS
jgi:hypothetical protein